MILLLFELSTFDLVFLQSPLLIDTVTSKFTSLDCPMGKNIAPQLNFNMVVTTNRLREIWVYQIHTNVTYKSC